MKNIEPRNAGRLNNSKTWLAKRRVTDIYKESHKEVKSVSEKKRYIAHQKAEEEAE